MGVYVYKSKHMDAIKIGHYSKTNPWGRVLNRGFYSCIRPTQIQNRVSAEDLEIMCWYPALKMTDEKKLHRDLVEYRLCGEWFRSESLHKLFQIVPEENKVNDYIAMPNKNKCNIVDFVDEETNPPTLNLDGTDTIKYYTRQKEEWLKYEVDILQKEYGEGLSIMELGILHKRTPGSISYKLKNMGIINHNTLARGYKNYKNSILYKDIVSINRKEDNLKKERQKSKQQTSIKMVYPDKSNIELQELRSEVRELKQDVKEMLRLMNALYDFEISASTVE